jgi:hypothetical protein
MQLSKKGNADIWESRIPKAKIESNRNFGVFYLSRVTFSSNIFKLKI